jgi:predicted nucleic acid-binding protein
MSAVSNLFLDTNIFIRHLIPDHAQHHQACASLIKAIEAEKFTPHTSNIVILEVHYVLHKLYHQPPPIITQAVNSILSLPNLQVIETTNTPLAHRYYQRYHIKFGDCLIATQIPVHCRLITYDQEFQKLPFLSPQTPNDYL